MPRATVMVVSAIVILLSATGALRAEDLPTPQDRIVMKKRFRKCCIRSQSGKPSLTVRTVGGTPGYRTRKSRTAGKSRAA